MRHVWVVIGVLAACSSTNMPPADGYIALGNWGGDSAALIVSDTGLHLHVACTYGDVPGRVAVGVNGTFDVTGTYVLRAYPIMVGPSLPARFAGRLDRNLITVTVTVDDTVNKQTVVRGPVVVKYGADPRLMPCPICRRPIRTRAPAIFRW